MPEKKTMERAREDLREGKRPSTAAGEFVREEIEHIREGKHGAKSTKQALAEGGGAAWRGHAGAHGHRQQRRPEGGTYSDAGAETRREVQGKAGRLDRPSPAPRGRRRW